MEFSNSEKVNMFSIFVLCDKNAANAADTYRRAYPQRAQSSRTCFDKLEKNLRDYGSFSNPKRDVTGRCE